MDQDSTKGQEKRNWREKLGIGTNGSVGAPPKISDDFKKAAPATAPMPRATPRPDPAAKPAVKPAPMAPRPGSAPIAKAMPRPAAPVAPDKLAERLRSQRDASAKLAEQRVQVARQRVEAPTQPTPIAAQAAPQATSNAPKPKFAFAEEDANATRQVAPTKPQVPVKPSVQVQTQQRPAPPQPQATQQKPAAFQPQQAQQPALAPSRPSLGAAPQPFPPRPQVSNQPPAQSATPVQPGFQQGLPSGQTYPQQSLPGGPAGYVPPQQYGQQPPLPGYRPIDPATGYPQQPYTQGYGQPPFQQGGRPSFAPPPRVAPTPPPAYVPPGSGPRLNVPQRPGLNPNYGGIEPSAFNNPGATRQPPRVAREVDPYDDLQADDGLFDEPPQSMQRPPGRRPTSGDYQQAYRDAEAGFEDELPRSKLPWILPGILLIALMLTGAGVWAWQTYKKPLTTTATQQTTTQPEVPVVPAPTAPSRTQAEPPQQDATAGGTTRKQIYDRIVGDREVLGGQMVPTEETPAQPDANAIPQPVDGAAPAPGGDAVPLPIPPPPGSNTQGSLEPAQQEDPNKQSAENIPAAAGESQAAVAVPATGEPTAMAQNSEQNLPLPPPVTATPTADTQAAAAPTQNASQIADQTTDTASTDTNTPSNTEQIATETPKVVAPKKKITASINKLKSMQKKQMANLGSKPVVLVAPSNKAKQAAQIATVDEPVTTAEAPAASANDGLYGSNYVVNAPSAAASAEVQPKKKRTLADLFQGNNTSDAQTASNTVAEPTAPAAEPVVVTKPVAPVKVASASPGGYVAQLASFRSNAEATAEYARLKSKYGSTIGGLSPIISQASVAGTTRYRLAVGPFASRDAANAMCSKLFAAGERDCLVRN